MVKVIISSPAQQQLVDVSRDASNITWRSALNSVGFASFNLPLSSQFAVPKYLNAGNYLHIFPDNVDSTSYANASWGGRLVNDYEIHPGDGVITAKAAGLAVLFQTSIVNATTTFNGLDVGTVMNNLIMQSDNFPKLGLTAYTVSTLGPSTVQTTLNYGDGLLDDLYKLCGSYGMDIEVRPDFTYGIYVRQGQDNLNLVARYGAQGNIHVDSTMQLVNTEQANQVIFTDSSNDVVFVADQTSIQYYGPKTFVVQDNGDTFTQFDAQTKAQLYLARSAYPLALLDAVTLVDTSLYPFYLVRVGDKILFESPSLPMLSSFNGAQRVLAAEYNDTKRTMTLTLGNAIYKLINRSLHEVRLYESGSLNVF